MRKEELSTELRQHISRLGGHGRARSLTQEQRTRQAQKAALVRWSGTKRVDLPSPELREAS